MIEEESQYQEWEKNKIQIIYNRDYFTDYIMLKEAAFPGQYSPLEYAMKNPDCNEFIIDSKQDKVDYASSWNYGRYWHGYLIPLKLLLLVMPLFYIRVINLVIINLLFLWCLILMLRWRLIGMAISFTATLLLLGLQVMPMSMQYMSCTTIALIAIAVILQWNKIFSKPENLYVLFFAIGGLTSYIDLMTYPLLTLGMPAVVALYNKPRMGKTETGIRPLVLVCLCWGLGYGMIWSSKWILASVLTDFNFIADAINSIGIRTDHSQLQTKLYYKILIAYLVLYIVSYLAAALVVRIRFRREGRRLNYKENMYLIVIAVLPVIWLLVLYNHTLQHIFFTWRTYGVTLFALGCYCSQSSIRNSARNHERV